MKRFSVILVFIVIMFCSCSEIQTENFQIHKYFSSGVYISTEQINFKGQINYKKDGTLLFTVLSPDEVKNYAYTVKNNNVKMSFMGLENKCKINELPTYAPIAVINKVLNEIRLSHPKTTSDGKNFKAKINGFSVGFSQDGYIESINSKDLHITFIHKK